MDRQFIEQKKFETISGDLALPGSETLKFPFSFVLQRENRLFWLLPPSDLETTPSIIFSEEELRNVETWRLLLSLCPISTADLAHYSAKNPWIEPTIFLEATGSGVHYKNLENWREMGKLDADTRYLARKYDLPLTVLRLWNRLSLEERRFWNSIWEIQVVKKKHVREMIELYYELSAKDRGAVQKNIRDLCKNQPQKNSVFPGESAIATLKIYRYPRFESLRREIFNAKQQLKLGKRINLEIPPDLEGRELKLTITFQNAENLKNSLKGLDSAENYALFQKILDML